MKTFVAIVLGSTAVISFWLYKRYRKKKEIRQRFKNNWGKPKNKSHNWEKIRCYHDYLKKSSANYQIDDDTWDDLNLADIYGKIDHTVSPVGQQILYDILRSPSFDTKKLEKRKQFIEIFQDENFRINLQLKLNELNSTQIWRLPNLLFSELPKIPAWYNTLLLVPLLVLSCIVLGFVNPIFFIGLGIIPVLNMVVQYIVGKRVRRHTLALSGISPLLTQGKAIGELDSDYQNPLGVLGDSLRSQSKKLSTLNRRVHTYLHEGNHNSLGGLFWDYLDILLLLKINMFTLSVKNIAQNKATLKKLYRNIGYLDAMLAVSSFKSSLREYCHPEFTETNSQLVYKKAYHPLLEEPVANSITIEQKGILITGSNMSGKTTFLKTIGINQLVAQTLNFCFADQATLSLCNIITSMRREDNLQEGKSFYLGEVDRVKKLIDLASDSEYKNLFLLDEIFRGTNTIERISASLEVLKWLRNRSNFVLASTHDLELVDLLGADYEFYHFTETVRGEAMNFDYKIKEGHSSTRNAIKLLAINNYPAEIVTNALQTAEMLEEQGNVKFTASSK
jgi:DNA mismatch repair ATPase MutS